MSSSDESLDDPDATTYRPSSDPDATEYHAASGSSPAATGFTPDSRLNDNFRLEKQLGRGGMGEAWKAFDETANRFVVLKFIPKEIQHVKEAVDSVRDSFAKVHELQHQHICPVYGLFTDPHHGLYLVMKFIDGLPLDEYKRKFIEKHGKISFSDTVQILWGIAKGLDYAHEKRVIHRDIKPQNVMISKKDGVQIIDFGLAEEIRTSMVKFSEVTMDVAGTRPYMAPEQWLGRMQEARTDQYALAVTAYELFAGHVPFQGGDIGVLRECVLNVEPEPIAGLPEHVNAALLRGLAKKRDDRFENCKALVKAMVAKPQAAESIDAELAPDQERPEISTVPTLHSDPVSGRTQTTSWRPNLSTDPRKPAPNRAKKNPWIPAAGITAAVLLISGLVAFFVSGTLKKKPTEEPTVTAAKTNKPVKKATKTERPPVSASIPKPAEPPEPEFLTPEQYHQREIELVEWLWKKCNAHIQVQIDGQLKEFSTSGEPPKEFSKLLHLGFWSPNRVPGYAANANSIDCVIPGYRHNEKKCSCKLSPEELSNINRLKKNQYLHVGGLQLAPGDLEILLPDSSIWALELLAIPTLPHWEPIKNIPSLKKINAFANVLNRSHVEAVAALPNLEIVNFSQCHFVPGTLEPLAGNGSIRMLNLAGTTCLTGRDVAALARMNELTELNLDLTPLTAADLDVLAKATKLKKIKLSNNGLTAKEVDEFRQKHPGMELDLTRQTGFPLPFEEIPADRNEVRLADVVWKSAKAFLHGPGPCEAHSYRGKYEKSFFTPAPSELTYRPNGQWKRFESKIGIVARHTPRWYDTFRYIHTPGGGDAPSVVFVVKGDGKELYRSELITDGNERSVSVDISGVETLELIVEDGGDGPRFDAAAWFDPKLTRDAPTEQTSSKPKTDIIGRPRNVGKAPDIGAFEYQ